MKKPFLPLLILLTVFSLTASAQVEKPIKITITINLEIAAPKRNCESGFGICKLGASVSRTVSAGFYLENNLLTLYFDRTRMSDELENEFRAARFFPIDETSVLPAELWYKLGERSERMLKAGNYSIQATDEYYYIAVPLE